MEHYGKGKNIECSTNLADVPISNLSDDIFWIRVKPSSKMSNLITLSLEAFERQGALLISGVGPAVGKAVSCAEIIKKQKPSLHQITKVLYQKSEEYWNPKEIQELDSLKVVRQIPVIHILLSSVPCGNSDPGYQHEKSLSRFLKVT